MNEVLDFQFEKQIEYFFNDKNLLNIALTHPSCNTSYNYERLEFLGDAVIELIISDYLYTNYNNFSEGELTQKRSEIVCSKSLSAIARSIGLGKVLRLGKGEEQTLGREKASILENALEAIIGAIYLDGGYYSVKTIAYKFFQTTIDNVMRGDIESDYKSQLQEIVHKKLKKDVHYKVIKKEGPPHNLIFYVNLLIDDRIICEGKGSSKKEAEQNAAKFAVADFDNIFK